MASTINILFVGDIIGKPGLDLVTTMLKGLLEKHKIDLCIANGENVADGKGIEEGQVKHLFDLGVHVITGGNHTFDRWDMKKVYSSFKHLIRPLNFPKDVAGYGYTIYELKSGVKAGVINLQGRTYMQPIDDPFRSIDWALSKVNEQTKISFIDFHAEATAEKMAMGWYVDGRASVLVGTHTHTPTADARILPRSTGFITDVGMTGPYDSVLGMKKDLALKRFLTQTPHKYETATNEVRFCGVIAEVEIETGKCVRFEQLIFPKF
ncbi:MAG: TIGR00282 family metallophosphoesterase [Ignavibacteriales bacterium]|nr:TIGR00282 family metallophosphoesterase [Ignavibacteriales bacterium]